MAASEVIVIWIIEVKEGMVGKVKIETQVVAEVEITK